MTQAKAAKPMDEETAAAVVPKHTGDPDGWRSVVEDEGEMIDFDQIPAVNGDRTFIGTYRGSKIVNNEQTSGEDVLLLLFSNDEGQRFSMWANFRLEEAFGTDGGKIAEGSAVKIVHHGKMNLKDGGKTFNRMSVYTK